MKPEPPKFAVVKPETAEPEADQPQTSTVSTPGEAKPEAAKAESPKVDAAVIGPAPAKSTVMASESIGAAKPQMAKSPVPAAIPTPAVVQPAALPPVLAAAQPVLTAEAKPAAAQSVIPQVSSVQDRVLSVNETAQPRDGELATASSDPSLRAGRAAEKMAATPQNEQPSLAPRTPSSGQAAVPAPKYTGEPISVNLKDVDLKDFFRLIHEISGLNIVLDPNVRGSLTLVLDDVPWDQALDIVLKNGNLDRELQGNVLRIASTDTLRREAVDRRAQSEAIALAVDRQTITRSLSYAKASEAVPTIKKFLTARGDVISDQRTNTLIISDIPSVLPALDRLITTLDRKSEEVEIEVRVVSATRSFSRDLGVQLGFSWGNGVTTIGGSNPNNTSGTSVVNGVSTTSTIPLFSNFGASGATTGFQLSNITSNYGIDAVLTAAESHNLAKVLSRPRVVTQNNIKAEIKQGQKIPVYTQGTNNANSSVSYIDAVLRLSVTPQITADKTIFMTVDVENTQPNGTTSAGNYLLSTQQETTQVLVTDGGTVVIGGVIQTTNSVSTSQTPFLGSIPWLGNLFKERLVSTSTAELIFFITPKIVQM
jgi:type IV pilus assembly protein PilQ